MQDSSFLGEGATQTEVGGDLVQTITDSRQTNTTSTIITEAPRISDSSQRTTTTTIINEGPNTAELLDVIMQSQRSTGTDTGEILSAFAEQQAAATANTNEWLKTVLASQNEGLNALALKLGGTRDGDSEDPPGSLGQQISDSVTGGLGAVDLPEEERKKWRDWMIAGGLALAGVALWLLSRKRK